MALQLSPSKHGMSPISIFNGDTINLDKDYSITHLKEDMHIQLICINDGLQLRQLRGETFVYFAKDEEPFSLVKGEELSLPIGGLISSNSKKDKYYTLEKSEKKQIKRKLSELQEEESETGGNDKQKIEEIMSLLPECDEISIAIALCEANGYVEKAVEHLLQNNATSKRIKSTASEDKSEDDSKSLALALQLQDEINNGGFASESPMSNRIFEKRELAVIPLEHGVVLFKNCLSVDQQLGIYSQVVELYSIIQKGHHTIQNQAASYQNTTHPMAMLSVNWKGMQQQRLPDDLVQFAKDTHKLAYSTYAKNKDVNRNLPNKLVMPSSFTPTALHSILYPAQGKLHAHKDGLLGWVLSVSIGNSCIFSYSLDNKHKESVQLDSGDLVMFNGQEVYHEVEKIVNHTAPPFWGKTCDTFGFARFNLQFRDPTVMP